MKTFEVAAILTCFNRREKTLACLNALFQNTIVNDMVLEVFLVDDGSTDGTSEAVKASFPSVNVIKGSGDLFWNRGMHKAWTEASKKKQFDYYLWLNDDTFIFPNALSLFREAANETKGQAIIAGTTMSEKTRKLTYGGFSFEASQLLQPNGQLQKCKFFHGNVVLVPKAVFDVLGPHDPVFHHAIGDFDYGLRALKNKIPSYILTDFVAYCEDHETLPKWCLPQVPLKKRFNALYSPLGNSHPYFFFVFDYRHKGLLVALKHFFSLNLRMLMPFLWKY